MILYAISVDGGYSCALSAPNFQSKPPKRPCCDTGLFSFAISESDGVGCQCRCRIGTDERLLLPQDVQT